MSDIEAVDTPTQDQMETLLRRVAAVAQAQGAMGKRFTLSVDWTTEPPQIRWASADDPGAAPGCGRPWSEHEEAETVTALGSEPSGVPWSMTITGGQGARLQAACAHCGLFVTFMFSPMSVSRFAESPPGGVRTGCPVCQGELSWLR